MRAGVVHCAYRLRITTVAGNVKSLDLDPAAGMVSALDFADAETARSEIDAEAHRIANAGLSKAERKRAREPLRDPRKRWSERLATATATMIADEIRGHRVITPRFRVAPLPDGSGQETFWPLGYRSGKRIDVVVAAELAGLQLGVSLKGLNFRDDEGGQFDKNLTGRLYELADEMTTVHRHLPRAVMTGVFFMPVEACFDKDSGQSSFAHAVLDLRRRSDRDPSDSAHLSRCDWAAVALYSHEAEGEKQAGVPRGVVRFFDTREAPPRRGLPLVSATMSLAEFTDRLLDRAIAGTAASDSYGRAEGDSQTPVSALDDVVTASESEEVDQILLEE